MDTTTADQFREVFQNSLKITSRSLAVKTLLNERNLKRINYSPYYQRNYVWDNEKQSFFIESVILGTEVPPLILFKTGTKVEVIDGRQRFETLKKFKEGDFSLSFKGLKELEYLSKKSFSKLPDFYSRTFLDSNIRVFEFEVINHPNLSDDIIDKVKKEIFRRYNTGITPLTRDELDNARYNTDEFSDYFKKKLSKDQLFFERFNACFFPKVKLSDNRADTISKNLDVVRRYRIIKLFPIATYAGAKDRSATLNILYEFANNNCVDVNEDILEFERVLSRVLEIHSSEYLKLFSDNKLIFETLLWALTILERENIIYVFESKLFAKFIKENSDSYSDEFSHYYGNVITRHETTASYFKEIFDFEGYVRSSTFSRDLKEKRQTAEETKKSVEELENLRLYRTNPTSIDVDEIRGDLKESNYLLRPTYQRQEKISHLKASSIIESILLGINLPTIFVFKRKDGIKEVIDGQQRLLSILGYLGSPYRNETGELSYSKNDSFKLKGLTVLASLEGHRFNDLDEQLQDKILDFVVDVIIIDEAANEKFDPIDLFIRLNYKPYPIKPNSFEMWNSIVNQEVIQSVKEIAKSEDSSWFFLREIKENKPDRMLNEELIISLAYMHFKSQSEGVIGFFPRHKTITCRIKDKKGFSQFLFNLDSTAIEKFDFVASIEKTGYLIQLLGQIIADRTKEGFNDFLNINKNQNFRRSLQDFYVIWLILIKSDESKIIENAEEFKKDVRVLLKMRLNPENIEINDAYLQDFFSLIEATQKKY